MADIEPVVPPETIPLAVLSSEDPPASVPMSPHMRAVSAVPGCPALATFVSPAPTHARTNTADPVLPSDVKSPVSQKTDGVQRESLDVTGLLSLGEASLKIYWTEGHVSALAEAVVAYRSAMRLARDGSEEKIKAHIGLADALCLEIEEGTGGDEHDRECLSLAEEAVAATAAVPALYADAVRALGEALFDTSHQQTTVRLQRTVDTFRQLVELTSDACPDIAVSSLARYARSLNTQWLFAGDPKVIELANSAVNRAMSIRGGEMQTDDARLCHAYMSARDGRFRIAGNMADMSDAISRGQRVVSGLPPGHPWVKRLWNLLGNLYKIRERLIGTDLHDRPDQALTAFGEARKRVGMDHPNWHLYNGNYAMALAGRFLSQSTLEDLNEATTIARGVVSRIAETGYRAQQCSLYISNLVAFLILSYAQYGNLDELDEAVAFALEALDHATVTIRGAALNNLSIAYHMRYCAHGRLVDLQKAISLQEETARQPTGPFQDFVDHLFSLAESLLSRFDECGRPEDMERTISVLQTAVAYPQEARKGAVYSLLGLTLLKRGIAAKSVQDIEESIRLQGEALDNVTDAHMERFLSYRRLGLAEYNMFKISQRAIALQNSVRAYSQSLSIMPPDHPDRAAYLLDLAKSQLAASRVNEPEEMTPILRTLGEAAIHAQSWPADRYAAAALWARTAHRTGCLSMALDAYRLALSLLPQVAWLGLEDELRVQRLSHQPPDISQDAAACAMELGLCDLAVEIIDGSRSILWNTSQELRAELDKLKETAPDLARELAQTNAALAFRPGGAQDEQDPRSVESERRRIHRLATRRTELLHLVRSLPGFQRFLVPVAYDSLCHASREGPVVILISSTYRCDALILQEGKSVTLVPLPNVTHRLVLAQAEALQKSLRLTGDLKGRAFLDKILLRILRDLWEKIGNPICLALGQEEPSPHLRRIWWCRTGAMTLLPFHVCGPYNGVDPNMPDLFVSSYTPTLAALLRSRKQATLSQPISPPRVLVIAQPEFLNRPPLPCAMAEARVLFTLLPSLSTFRIGPEGTVARVQEMLREHSWLHISSHGSQNSSKPLESSIALYDGDLKLSDLAQERMPNAEFAFLSACHSARNTDSLPDEAMHLAAGMMFAGFRSVVATSWAIADKDAPVIAKVFYQHLIRHRKTPVVTETAEALHLGVKHLRDSDVPLHQWVPFIHLGA